MSGRPGRPIYYLTGCELILLVLIWANRHSPRNCSMIRGVMAVYPERGDPTKVEWNAHYSRWVPLLNNAVVYDAFKYPDIQMDFVGLSDKDNFGFLGDYDFIYLYLHPVDKVQMEARDESALATGVVPTQSPSSHHAAFPALSIPLPGLTDKHKLR